MDVIVKITKYEMNNAFRSKWIILYALFFFAAGYGLFSFEAEYSKAILSLMTIVIIVIPLVSSIFGVMYFYNSREFIEMMLCQPINRKSLFIGIFLGTVIPLSTAFAVGVISPILLTGHYLNDIELIFYVLIIGIMLTAVFSSLAFLISIKNNDKVKGLGISIFIWLVFTMVYDGLILLAIYLFQDYPLEKPVLLFSLLNPVDLGRIIFLLKFDISALMGYTGAVFQKFFGGRLGFILSIVSLLFWVLIPFLFSLKFFRRKDF